MQVCSAAPVSSPLSLSLSRPMWVTLPLCSPFTLLSRGSAVSLAWNNCLQLSTLDRAHTHPRQKPCPGLSLQQTLTPPDRSWLRFPSLLLSLPAPQRANVVCLIVATLITFLFPSELSLIVSGPLRLGSWLSCAAQVALGAGLQPNTSSLPHKSFVYGNLRSWSVKH